jgi:hypothetical protein
VLLGGFPIQMGVPPIAGKAGKLFDASYPPKIFLRSARLFFSGPAPLPVKAPAFFFGKKEALLSFFIAN